MIKLLIADDEKIIRETISTTIDWATLGIELIGSAANGIEAYNTILDEYPDIVLTDIKMPGLSGLELIERIKKINQDTEFIILSGYNDFSYAQEAMRYGVKHYLLKPCNENQIIECIRDILSTLAPKRVSMQSNIEDSMVRYFESNIILTIISESISQDTTLPNFTLSNTFHPYFKYLDFYNESYQLCYLYFVEKFSLIEVLNKMADFQNIHYPGILFNSIYVNNTLLLFYKSFGVDKDIIDNFMNNLFAKNQTVTFQYERKEFKNLDTLLNTVLTKIKRYDTICYSIDGYNLMHICNFKNILQEFDKCITQLKSNDSKSVQNAFIHFKQIVKPITDLNLLRQIVSSSIMQITSYYSPTTIRAASEKLFLLNQMTNSNRLTDELILYLEDVIDFNLQNNTTIKISEQIKKIVSENLEDSNLSLKWIAENYLYMNVDYLSKKFLNETGERFSNYLTYQRISRSKVLLKQYNSIDKIKVIAELVGCGNNPQYFSNIFKKVTGMSPSNYIKTNQGE